MAVGFVTLSWTAPTNLSDGNVQRFVTTNNYFHLTDVADFAYGEMYNILVQVQRRYVPTNTKEWLGYYGPGCRVSSPTIYDLHLELPISLIQVVTMVLWNLKLTFHGFK